jgi:hypothetical protein
MVYTVRFFSSKCSLFHNYYLVGSCIIHILYTGVLKLKKNNNSGAKRLISHGADGKFSLLHVIFGISTYHLPDQVVTVIAMWLIY